MNRKLEIQSPQSEDVAGSRSKKTRGLPSRRAVVAGLGASLFAPAVRAQAPMRELKLGIASTSFAAAPVRAAVELGCFARNGIKATTPVLDSGSNVTTAMIAGSLEVIVGGPGEQIAAAARGIPIVLLTNVYWGQSGTLLLAKDIAEKSGLGSAASLKDKLQVLEGVTIASVSPTSALTATFKGAADKLGIKLSFVFMAQSAMNAALESGAIKGFIASAPIWGPAVVRGRAVEWLSAPKGELPDENVPRGATAFHAMRPFAEANPDLMKKVLASYRDFSDILEKTPERVRETFGKLYPDVEPAAMDVLFNAEKRAFRMRDVTVADMQHEIDFVKASGASIPGIEKIDAASLLYVPPK